MTDSTTTSHDAAHQRGLRPPSRPQSTAPAVATEEDDSLNTVSTDLPCHNCSYNLRGQPEAGQCPECGETVAMTREVNAIPAIWTIQRRLAFWSLLGTLIGLPVASFIIANIWGYASVREPLRFAWLCAAAASVALLPLLASRKKLPRCFAVVYGLLLLEMFIALMPWPG